MEDNCTTVNLSLMKCTIRTKMVKLLQIIPLLPFELESLDGK